MVVLITCKNKEDLIKTEGARVFTTFFYIISLWRFLQKLKVAYSTVLSPTLPIFELVRDIMVVFITCKNEEDPKLKELECRQDFPSYNPMGAICCHGHQGSDPI